MARKSRDPILDKVASEGLFGRNLSEVDLSKPFIRAYDAGDKGREIQLLLNKNGKILTAGYLGATEALCEKGMHLPSNVLHDDYFANGKWVWLQIGPHMDKYYPAWAREILAYPETNGVFVSGKDIVDARTGCILPAQYVPQEAFGVEGIGLFIDPEAVEWERKSKKLTDGRMVVHPRTIIIVNNILQEPGSVGSIDPVTRIPIYTGQFTLAKMDERKKCVLYRLRETGVRPISRREDGSVDACMPSLSQGVGGIYLY
jgi:hypothetical protein